MLQKEKIISAGKYLFLAGVALLIVRNNSYPFFVKRSSDILFALSAIAALYVIFRYKAGYENFLKNKNVLWGISLITAGLITASLSGYFSEGLVFTKEGLLNIGRFAEIFAIVFLVSFFQNFDVNFYKKAALAQLSTLVYLPTLLFPDAKFVIAMYRFDFLENWPSNVGYYLIASITCIAVLTLVKAESFKKLCAYYALGIGLSSVFLWTQSRAAWLGLILSLILVVLFLGKISFKKMAAATVLIVIAFLTGFFILRGAVKNDVSARIFPSAIDTSVTINSDPQALTPGLMRDPHRLELWGIYLKKLAERPLGLGINYEPVDSGDGPQGPHNTVLEFLVLAGPLGLAGFVLILFTGFKNIFKKIKKASYGNLWLVYIFSSLAGLLVASMFDNMSLFRLIWLVAGMAVYA